MSDEGFLKYLKLCGGTPHFMNQTWDSMDSDPTNQQAFDLAANFEWYGKRGLFIHGEAGCGKTRIAKGMFMHYVGWKYNHLQELDEFKSRKNVSDGRYSQWISASEYINSQRGAPDKRHRDRVMDASVLFIDDIGSVDLTEWGKEQVWMLIDHFYRNEKQLVVTSNETIERLGERYGIRVSSRLNEMLIPAFMKGGDKRLKKQHENFQRAINQLQRKEQK